MSATRPRTLLMICVSSLIGITVSGCGIPRVNEVYRPSEAHASVNQDWASMGTHSHGSTLHAMAISAQAMQEVHQRKSKRASSQRLPLDATSAPAFVSGNLHDRRPEGVAEFTTQSANVENEATDGEMLARVRHHW